jgi:hypothetical protein
MNWPTHSDYQEAIQNPNLCFQTPELMSGEVVADMLGLPRVISGNFASVYELKLGTSRQAIRCFVRQVPGQQGRYILLSKYLANVRLDYLVKFEFALQGIRVHEQWYPIVQMEWVDGSPLNVWIEEHVHTPGKMLELAAKLRVMMRGLRQYRIAHGDLQHGNLMVTPGEELRLVDYDGMYCPVFGRGHAPELGHPNFQHPRRAADYYEEGLDNFSALTIHASLLALAADPSLFTSFYSADNLLFSSSDYKNPMSSPVFERLKQSSDVRTRKLAVLLQQCCAAPIEQTPWYEETLVKLEQNEPLTLGTPAPPRIPRTASASRPVSRSSMGMASGSRSISGRQAPPGKSNLIPTLLGAALLLLLAIAYKLYFGSPATPPVAPPPAATAPTAVMDAPAASLTRPPAPPPTPLASPQKATLLGTFKGLVCAVDGLAISPDNRLFASGGGDGVARLWDLQTGELKYSLPVHNEGVKSMVWFADGLAWATVTGDNLARVWDAATGVARKTMPDHQSDVWAPAFSPDGRTLAAGASNRKVVRLIDWATGAVRATLPEHKSWVRGADFSDDGKVLATYCFDDSVSLWNVAGGQPIRTYAIPTNGMDFVVFAPGSQLFATAGESATVKIWGLPSANPQLTLPGHSGTVRSLVFATNGKLLFSGGNDRNILVWEIPSGRLLHSWNAHNGAITSLAVSRDNRILISGSSDKTIKLWDISKPF